MPRLLIVYYSFTGGSEQMAAAAAEAAQREDGTETVLMRAEVCQPADMLSADGYLFVTPENLAAMAGVMKAFFDRNYYPLLGQIEGRPYGAMICAGSDGENALKQLERIATGWRLRKVVDSLIVCTHAQTEAEILARKSISADDLAPCAEMGAALATGLALGVF